MQLDHDRKKREFLESRDRLVLFANQIDFNINQVLVSGCVCGFDVNNAPLGDDDTTTCMFCRPIAPEYRRLWAERAPGDDLIAATDIGVVPNYDESGAGDHVLVDREDRLTADGRAWITALETVQVPSGDAPQYRPAQIFEFEVWDWRRKMLRWYFGRQRPIDEVERNTVILTLFQYGGLFAFRSLRCRFTGIITTAISFS